LTPAGTLRAQYLAALRTADQGQFDDLIAFARSGLNLDRFIEKVDIFEPKGRRSIFASLAWIGFTLR